MREKRSRSHGKEEPLFDYPDEDFDPGFEFIVDFEGISTDFRRKTEAEAAADRADHKQQTEHVKAQNTEPNVFPRSSSSEDPLNPDVFLGHHRRMEREERRMQVMERQGLMTTALRLKKQREQLEGGDWRDHIDRIVRIVNENDRAEMDRKRKLALTDINTFLTKFDEYYRRVNRRDSKSPSKSSRCKSSKKLRPKASKPPPDLPVYEPPSYDKELTLFLRPFAFGEMLPPRLFPPQEFMLPPLLRREVESYDLVEKLEKRRKKMRL